MKSISVRPITMPVAADRGSDHAEDAACILPGYSSLAAEFRHDCIIAPRRFPLRPTQRLVVLIPEGSLDEGALARKIWLLASTFALPVHLLGLSPDEESASAGRRRLALLAASLHHGQVSASMSIGVRENWIQAVGKVRRNGDLLVCIARHRVPYHIVSRRSLGQALLAAFNAPVYMLGDLQIGRSQAQLQLVRSVAAWSLSLIILLAFAWFQIQISQHQNPLFSPLLLSLSIILEGIALLKAMEWLG